MANLPGFDEFWKNYPRRIGKLAAMRKYKIALNVASAAEIIRGAELYAKERSGKEEQFTAHPATWLHAGRWDAYTVPAPVGVVELGFYAAFCSAELDAWNAYGRQTKGLNYPADKRGGWHFPTRWPPNHKECAA